MVIKEFEIYVAKNYIYRTNKDGNGCTHYIYSGISFYNDFQTFSTYLSNNTEREATLFEKQWLNECIKQNKFVPKDKIKFNPIYELW